MYIDDLYELKRVYRDYKKGIYDKKVYNFLYEAEIRDDLKNGKKFVFKGRVSPSFWLAWLITFGLEVGVFVLIFLVIALNRPIFEVLPLISFLIIGTSILNVFMTLLVILGYRAFIVIGMQGVYYNVLWMKKDFAWSQVQEIGMKDALDLKYRHIPGVSHVIKIGVKKKFSIVFQGNKTRYFEPKMYKSKEFPKKRFEDFFKTIFLEAASLNIDLAVSE